MLFRSTRINYKSFNRSTFFFSHATLFPWVTPYYQFVFSVICLCFFCSWFCTEQNYWFCLNGLCHLCLLNHTTGVLITYHDPARGAFLYTSIGHCSNIPLALSFRRTQTPSDNFLTFLECHAAVVRIIKHSLQAMRACWFVDHNQWNSNSKLKNWNKTFHFAPVSPCGALTASVYP